MRGVLPHGDRVRELRTNCGWTQEVLAACAQVDAKSVRKVERGNAGVDLSTVARIASALNVPTAELMVQCDKTSLSERNIALVRLWHDAFLAGDLELLLSLHAEDTVLEIPAASNLPAAENFRGIDAFRQHMEGIFQVFRIVSVSAEDFEIHAINDLVFLRTTATIEFLPAKQCYTARHLNEFQIREGLIVRRVVIADYGELRKILEEFDRKQRLNLGRAQE